jgi:hypothetical protein
MTLGQLSLNECGYNFVFDTLFLERPTIVSLYVAVQCINILKELASSGVLDQLTSLGVDTQFFNQSVYQFR